MSVHEHKEKAKKSIRCFVVTVSDTRDETTDTSGQAIKKFLSDEGHQTDRLPHRQRRTRADRSAAQ